jgi:hypothetical protein
VHRRKKHPASDDRDGYFSRAKKTFFPLSNKLKERTQTLGPGGYDLLNWGSLMAPMLFVREFRMGLTSIFEL